MSYPEPRWRWIAPHAIAFDGFRWHTRAFCCTDDTFKDFVLPRIIEIRKSEPFNVQVTLDSDWQSRVAIIFAPHPRLSPGQRAAIEFDYRMSDGQAAITVRKSLFTTH
nr:WYL domain-containing protein [Acuticoccus kalidii]